MSQTLNPVKKQLKNQVKKNDDGSVTYTLTRPIQLQKTTIKEFTLREPEFGDIEHFDLGNLKGEHLNALISNLSGQLPAIINRLSVQDGRNLWSIVADFLADGLGISEEAEPNLL